MLFTWPSHWLLTLLGPPLAPAHENEVSATFIRLCLCSPRSPFINIREYQTPSNLVPTLRVPRHLEISRAAVIRLPYIIGTISRSSRRSSCHATHTVQNAPLFCSSHSCKLATLGKCHMVGMSFVLFGFTWVYLELLLFLFFLFILYV